MSDKKIQFYDHGEFFGVGQKRHSNFKTYKFPEEIEKFSNEYRELQTDKKVFFGGHTDVRSDGAILELCREGDTITPAIPTPSGETFKYEYNRYDWPSHRLYPIETRVDENTFYIPGQYEEAETYVKKFLTLRDKYAEFKFAYRTGLLLYGPPGNGKTAFIRYLIQSCFKDQEITVIWTNSTPDLTFTKALKNFPGIKVIIFEELSTAISDSYEIKQFLEFMDGENSLDDCIVFATTNYPENLPGNIVERPGRFDRVIKFDNPDAALRGFLIKQFMKLDGEVDAAWVAESAGFSLVEIKEACIRCLFNDTPFVEACKQIKAHKELVKNDFEERRKIGI